MPTSIPIRTLTIILGKYIEGENVVDVSLSSKITEDDKKISLILVTTTYGGFTYRYTMEYTYPLYRLDSKVRMNDNGIIV